MTRRDYGDRTEFGILLAICAACAACGSAAPPSEDDGVWDGYAQPLADTPGREPGTAQVSDCFELVEWGPCDGGKCGLLRLDVGVADNDGPFVGLRSSWNAVTPQLGVPAAQVVGASHLDATHRALLLRALGELFPNAPISTDVQLQPRLRVEQPVPVEAAALSPAASAARAP